MAFNKGISLNPREERENAGLQDIFLYIYLHTNVSIYNFNTKESFME